MNKIKTEDFNIPTTFTMLLGSAQEGTTKNVGRQGTAVFWGTAHKPVIMPNCTESFKSL